MIYNYVISHGEQLHWIELLGMGQVIGLLSLSFIFVGVLLY